MTRFPGKNSSTSLPRRRLVVVMLTLVASLVAVRAHAATFINVSDWVMRVGDDVAWADPAYDNSDWESIEFNRVPESDSVIWLRATVELTEEHLTRERPLGIYVAAIASHEVWWDGEVSGRGGVVGASPEEETPGPIEAHYVIPERLAQPGPHVIAMRVSAHHRHFKPLTGYWVVIVGEYDALADSNTPGTTIALISLSGILMMAIFALLMFAQDPRDKSFLYLGLLCITAVLLLLAESYRDLVGYTYNWHILRLIVVTALSWLLGVLLLVFFAVRFPMKNARAFVVTGALISTIPILVSVHWDPKSIIALAIVFVFGTAWCTVAAAKGMRGSLAATIGIAVCLAAVVRTTDQFLDRDLYLALDFLFVCLLASHVQRVRQVRIEREEALMKSARLEIELLRKHIQPHFLMNTLTALSEWIEEEPAVAAGMIQSLADEFRLLSDIADRKLIGIDQEVRLCRSHLEIMSHRKGRTYRMKTAGLRPGAAVPPAVIHTLVENAITHNDYGRQKEIELRLTSDSTNGYDRYTFVAPPGRSAAMADTYEGTGLRYIRARLTESFGKDWTLTHGPGDDGWTTRLEIPARTVEAD